MGEYVSKPPITSWNEFCKITPQEFKSVQNKKWIFRGHIPGKPLLFSLDRAVQYYPSRLRQKNKAEKALLREFKRRYHQYSSDAPEDEDHLEWLSIMQHYGAPTRLLDFAYSPHVAAYFALEYAGENKPKGTKEAFEIFAINAKWAVRASAKINNFKKNNNFFSKYIGNTDKDRKDFKRYFIDNSSKKFVCPFNPFRLTERISLQNSVFMCPGNVMKTFDENLRSLCSMSKIGNIVVLTLEFDRQEIITARGRLYDLNITRATLFPGLEGFAKSLTIYPPKMLMEKDV
jgi:hypothetical protein